MLATTGGWIDKAFDLGSFTSIDQLKGFVFTVFFHGVATIATSSTTTMTLVTTTVVGGKVSGST
jgi:hypothetical protein